MVCAGEGARFSFARLFARARRFVRARRLGRTRSRMFVVRSKRDVVLSFLRVRDRERDCVVEML